MCDLIIKNTKTGLSKTVDASNYTKNEFKKTFDVYVDAGYSVKISRGE